MKLEVGMYVRTKKYGIAKIIGGISDKFNIDVFKKDGYTLRCQKERDILKASFNIIDLIEVGDYVNGERVIGFGTFYYDDGTIERTSLTLDRTVTCLNSEIKSIVTHEQMEQRAYKVEE